MKNTMLVVVDLGGFKAYRLDTTPLRGTPRLELLEEFSNPGVHSRLVDKVSDLSGRFPRSTAASEGGGAMSDGERLNMGLEWRRRLVRRLAQRLGNVLRRPEVERCYLAASLEINHQLLAGLDPSPREKIQMNLAADLTKIDKSDLLRHFQPLAQSDGSAETRTFA